MYMVEKVFIVSWPVTDLSWLDWFSHFPVVNSDGILFAT